jgi:hypothetical protein
VDGVECPCCRTSEVVVVDAEPRNQFQLPSDRVMSSIDVGQTGASGGVTNLEGVKYRRLYLEGKPPLRVQETAQDTDGLQITMGDFFTLSTSACILIETDYL